MCPSERVGSSKRIIHYTILAQRLCVWEIKLGERELIWCEDCAPIELWFWIFISMGNRSTVSGSGSLALAFFIHSLWVVFRIDNRSNYAELSKALSTSVEMSMTWITPGSLCLI
jgi:hypothetical protein